MKRFLLHKSIFTALLLIGIILSASAQDWTNNLSKLYYVGSNGKVFMEPDYKAGAVYFNKDKISPDIESKFTQKISRLKSKSDDVQIMNRKGMIRIKNTESLQPIKTPEDRKNFLKNYDLNVEGAYEVLPAFWVGDKQAWLTKQVTIRLENGLTLADITSTLDKYGASFIKNVVNQDIYVLRVENIGNQLPLIQELDSQDVLVWGEPDFKVDLVMSTNDPMYSDSWHLNNTGGSIDGKALVADIDVNAPEAWAITTGNSNIVVAVIDDGVEAHEDMTALLPGYTPVENGGDGTPSLAGDGHGQQVAGLISAQHNSIGAAGIAPGVSMFSVNIFAPNTTNTDLAEGVVWAVDHGADVLSNSWGFGSCTYDVAALTDAFAYAATSGRNGKGCIVLIASGNDFQSCVSYPANLPTVTAVGGISGDGERSMYSNYGPALDIVAPSDDDWRKLGRNYYSTGTHGLRTIDRMGSAGWYAGNYSESFGGTSGATPQVSAVAALVLSVNPNLTKAQVEDILYTSAKNVGDENQYGAGLVDAYAAVVAASGGGGEDTEAPTTPENLASSNITTSSFTLSWTASTDNIGVTGYDVYQGGSMIGSTAGTSYNVTGLSPATNYSYYVKAKDAAGNVSSASATLGVTTLEEAANTAPVADAGGPYSGDEGTVITFDGSGSYDLDGDALTYSWDFDDGSTGTGETPSHTYASAGTYTATLTVSDGELTDQATASVTVNSTGVDQAMISSISMVEQSKGVNNTAVATIMVTSEGGPVANATVSVTWTGNVSGNATGTTSGDGTVSFTSAKVKNATGITITITDISASGYYWDIIGSQTTSDAFKSGLIKSATNSLLEFKAYPNPVSDGFLNIQVPDVSNDVRATVYDMTGRARIQRELTNIRTILSIENLKPGLYILRVEGLDQLKTQKIIVN